MASEEPVELVEGVTSGLDKRICQQGEEKVARNMWDMVWRTSNYCLYSVTKSHCIPYVHISFFRPGSSPRSNTKH